MRRRGRFARSALKQIVEEKPKIVVAVHFLIESEANEYIKTLLEQQNPANSNPTIDMDTHTEDDIFQVYDADNRAVKGVFLSYKNALEYKQMLTKNYERNFTISIKKVNHNECCTMFQILHQL